MDLMIKLVTIFSVIFNFGAFIIGAFAIFERKDMDQGRLRVVSYLILLLMIGSVAALLISKNITTYFFAFGLIPTLLSTVLFFQCYKIVRNQKLTPVYSKDCPSFILQKGPYKYIRHPFYASYILTFLGSAIAANVWWSYSITGLIFYLYHEASQAEEKKFAKSSLSSEYQAYRKSTGRFTPRLNRY